MEQSAPQPAEAPIKTEQKKSIPLIFPFIEQTSIPLSADAQKALIINSMCVPFSELQTSDENLTKLSQNEIEKNYKHFLTNPPQFEEKVDIDKLKFDERFDPDEDFILLTYNNNKKRSNRELNFETFIKEWLYIFKPFRSIKSLEERANQINEWSEEEVEKFYDLYSNQILDEKLFADSTLPSCEQPMLYTHSRCSYDPIGKIIPNEAIDKEIASLDPFAKQALRDQKYDNCLAILRSEKYEFRMKNQAIMIGRGSADQIVDIELNFVSEKPCNHVSRNQAIISFLEDCNFYIENCGNRAFRVNGALIPVGAMGILPPNSILDFSDALLVFIPNLKFVDDIKEAMKKTPQTSSKSKKKNDNI